MSVCNGKIDYLKQNLSSVLKKKLMKENEGLILRNKENLYSEELSLVKTEINHLTNQLQDLKSLIHLTLHQISLVNICSTTEKCKTEYHIIDLNSHKRKIDEMINKVNNVPKGDLVHNEAEEQNIKRNKEIQMATNQKLIKEAIAVEKECDSIESECIVLKKRNNAIMLKLRRKLVETENLRKELMMKKDK